MSERTQIAWLSAGLGLSIGVGFSLWLEASTETLGFLIPAFWGSLTALMIAFGAYPWQKELDRKADFGIEQRAALRDFLEGWYSLAMDTNELTKLKPNKEDPAELIRRLLEIRAQRQKLTFSYILICPEDDVEHVIDLDSQHDIILNDIRRFLQDWLDSPETEVLPFTEYRELVRCALDSWRNPHRESLAVLVNSCRERTPFVELKTSVSSATLGAAE